MVGGYAVFSADWGSGRETWRVPMVLDVETSYNASLTEIPTMIYGVDSNFVMDLGTVRQFYLSCARVHADNVSDPDDPEHGDLSNGEWIKGFRAFWDHWQNLSYEDGRIQGGADFQFIPEFAQDRDAADGDSELIPPIGTNVFLMGSLSPTYGVQKMTWSMQLLEARVFSEDVVTKRVTMTFRVSYGGKSEDQVRSYPVGSQFKLPNPTAEQSALLKDGSIVTAWTSQGVTYQFGTAVVAKEDMDGKIFDAVLKSPKAVFIRQLAYERDGNDIIVPSGCSRADVTLVGAGGERGDRAGTLVSLDDGNTPVRYQGGAGGGGQVVSATFTGLKGGDTIEVEPGRGFFKMDGSSGGTTRVSVVGGGSASARGGSRGSDATDSRMGGAGGQLYVSGGSTPGTDMNGDDGEGKIGIPGKGGKADSSNDPIIIGGGAGGGAADFGLYMTKAAIVASGEATTSSSITYSYNHGQRLNDTVAICSDNVTINSRDFGTTAKVTATINEEGPWYIMFRVHDNWLGGGNMYQGISGFYVKPDSADSKIYFVQSKGGDGIDGSEIYQELFRGGSTTTSIGFLGGGAGSGSTEGYGGDGAAIIRFFE